jgi:hypothetical protein
MHPGSLPVRFGAWPDLPAGGSIGVTDGWIMANEPTESQEIADFVSGLRKLREEAGAPSLREMARTAHYSHTALSSVTAGGRLPSLELTLAFVRACRGDEEAWRRRWQQVRDRAAVTAEESDTEIAPRRPRRRGLLLAACAAALLITASIATVMVMTSGPGHVLVHRSQVLTQLGHVACPGRPDPGDRPLIPCDDDRFIADVTIPDGTTVHANQRFDKVWEIQNTGLVPWRGRYLQRQGVLQGPGICTSAPRVPIPATIPGDDVDISVLFTAPSLPGSCRVDWKMTDGRGRLYFPDRAGLYITINVTG